MIRKRKKPKKKKQKIIRRTHKSPFKISIFLELRGVKGDLGNPKLNPIEFRAYLTGIGFTSENKEEIKGSKSNCNLLEVSKSPSKKQETILWVYNGLILAKTEITPIPPKDKIGKIWSSLPE